MIEAKITRRENHIKIEGGFEEVFSDVVELLAAVQDSIEIEENKRIMFSLIRNVANTAMTESLADIVNETMEEAEKLKREKMDSDPDGGVFDE